MSQLHSEPDNRVAASSASPLRNPVFRGLWLATGVSHFGSHVQIVAIGWLMASMTASPQMIALVQAAVSLPITLLILFAGALADNFDRRRLMLSAQVAMLLLSLLLAGFTMAGAMTPWLLLAFTFLISGGSAMHNPAWQASVRDIVPRASISRAIGLNSTTINLSRTLGPAVGGAIVSLASVAVAFIVNALSYAGLIVMLIRWRPERAPRTTPREPLLGAMLTGIRYASLSPYVATAMIRGGLLGFASSAVVALMPVVARQELGGGAFLYGLLLGAYGAGAVSGALMGGRLREKWSIEWVVRCAAASVSAGALLLALAPSAPIAALGTALAGLGWVLSHSSLNTAVQLSAAAWVSARSLALYQTATFGAMVLGSGFHGWLAEQAGVSSAFLAASLLLAIGGLITSRMRIGRVEMLNLDPLGRWQLPELDLDVKDSDGPIFVELEFDIAVEDTAEFLGAMKARARIRRRDGARNWELWQDLQDRSRWIESYRVRTWADYVRHNSRRTQADVDQLETLLRLNRRPGGPLVRRYLGRR